MKSIRKALLIFETLLSDSGGMSLSDLAKSTKLNISTVHGIVSVLVEKGYIKQAKKRGKYSIGIKFLEFGEFVKRGLEINAIARPYMEKLRNLVNELVHLAVLDRYSLVITERVQSNQSLVVVPASGIRFSLHNTGLGKVLLAHMPDIELQRFVAGRNFTAYTANTITDFDELKKQLLDIRRKGYAIDDEEQELGIRDIAAPILNNCGEVIASVGIAGPTVRLTDQRLGELASAVQSCASEISEAIGYRRIVNKSAKTKTALDLEKSSIPN